MSKNKFKSTQKYTVVLHRQNVSEQETYHLKGDGGVVLNSHQFINMMGLDVQEGDEVSITAEVVSREKKVRYNPQTEATLQEPPPAPKSDYIDMREVPVTNPTYSEPEVTKFTRDLRGPRVDKGPEQHDYSRGGDGPSMPFCYRCRLSHWNWCPI